MAKRKQRHYQTEDKILTKIDEKKAEAGRLNALAESLEHQSKKLLKRFCDECYGLNWDEMTIDQRNLKCMGVQCKEDALRAHKLAKRIESVVLPKLGEALSEFRTLPMFPIMGSDNSVASSV